MIIKEIKKSSGAIAKVLIALAIIVLIALGIAYIVVERAKKNVVTPPPVDEEVVVPKPVYDMTLNDIKFTFIEAVDKGSILYGKDSRYSDWQKDIRSTERFIIVKVSAQNIGKENTPDRIWGLGEITDSEGRVFPPADRNYSSNLNVDNWLPDPNLCGSVLKPSFEPTSCIRIYEVAKVSTGLKIKIFVNKNADSEQKAADGVLDVKLMP